MSNNWSRHARISLKPGISCGHNFKPKLFPNRFPFNQQSVLEGIRETIGLEGAREGSLYQFISAIRIPQPECIEKLEDGKQEDQSTHVNQGMFTSQVKFESF